MSLAEMLQLDRDTIAAASDRVLADIRAACPQVVQAGLDTDGPLLEAASAVSDLLGRRAAGIDHAATLFDPAAAPVAMLPWLAGWYGLGWLFVDPDDPRRRLGLPDAFPPGADRLRALLLAAPRLNRLRGRAEGLTQTLAIATGIDGFDVQPCTDRQHLVIAIPPMVPEWLPWLHRMIAETRPVHMTWSPDNGERSR